MSEKKVSGTIIVTGVIDGQDGQSPVVLSLRCSAAVVSFKEDSQGTVTCSPETYRLSLERTEGEKTTLLSAVPSGYSLKYNEDGTGWVNGQTLGELNAANEFLNGSVSEISYGLFKGDTLMQKLTVTAEWPEKGDKGDKGNPGNDAVVYSLQCSPDAVNFRSNAVGEFSGSQTVECLVKKVIGNAAPATISPKDMRYDGKYYLLFRLLPNGDWNIGGNTVTVTAADAVDDGVTGMEFVLAQNYDQQTYAPVGAADRKVVPVICDGRRGAAGATGKMFYPMGEWNATTAYSRTGDLVPLVFLPDPGHYNETIGAEGHYFYLYDDTNTGTRPVINDSSNPWRLCDTFGIVITQGLFAEFAKMGKGIFSGDYFFSMNGRIGSQEYIAGATYTEGGVTRPAYTWFKGDPTQQPSGTTFFYPNWWVDLKTGKMSAARGNFVVEGNGDVLVSGTIRARNLFHNVCTFRDGGYYSNNWFYLKDKPTIGIYPTDADIVCEDETEYNTQMAFWSRYNEGGYYEWTDADATEEYPAPPAPYFVQCSGDADTIIIMARSADFKWQYDVPLMLPSPDDFDGKLITVISRVRDGQPEVACVKDGACFANNVYYNDDRYQHQAVYPPSYCTARITMLKAYYVNMYASADPASSTVIARRETFDKKVFHAQDGYWLRIE